ncbi:MAG: hypothetical protein Q9227_004024 [Pyrenula ochraceoflavens]
MDEASYSFNNEQEFWDGLDDIVSVHCETHELIDNVLRSFLDLTINSKGVYINSEYDIARCNYRLLSSNLFVENGDYVRQQLIYGLLQDDALDVLHVIVSFLLFDGRANEKTFEILNIEGAFPRLIDLIVNMKREEDAGLHRLLMELLYEMSRIQRIKLQDLVLVEDDFVRLLFHIIEEVSDDVNDPYHYPVIRVLLVLNEQFMVSEHSPGVSKPPSAPLTNKVMKILSSEGSKYKTFGENIILLLNRESETSLQLLTLKLLYLLFTTPATHEYFYTNDLRVLVDILVRNLLDLPEDAAALRHTYLRVLYPLLAHTQLRHPPHYKRAEIRRLLAVLVRGQSFDEEDAQTSTDANGERTESKERHMRYFEEVDETTLRLAGRCGRVAWLKDPELLRTLAVEVPPRLETESSTASPTSKDPSRSTTSPSSVTTSSPSVNTPPTPPLPRKLVKRHSSKTSSGSTASSSTLQPLNVAVSQLGMDVESARASNVSVLEVAAQREKPGVITPSRKGESQGLKAKKSMHDLVATGSRLKEKPPPPRARRSGWVGRKKEEGTEGPSHSREASESHDIPPIPTSTQSTAQPHEPTSHDHTSVSPPHLTEPHFTTPSLPKKPPPAPKTRRWRGKRNHKSLEDTLHQDLPPSQSLDVLPAPPPPPPKPPSSEDSPLSTTKESVSTALGHAQADAVTDISERMEEQRLVAPPNQAPPRGVVGPEMRVGVVVSDAGGGGGDGGVSDGDEGRGEGERGERRLSKEKSPFDSGSETE